MRIVIDTNIWVSGLLWKGLPWELLHLAESEEIEVCMAPAMIEELTRVLAYPKLQSRLQQLRLSSEELITYAIELSSIFEIPEDNSILVKDDPDDDIFLQCAIASGAAYVVSGDYHLLDLKAYADIPILTVQEFFIKVFPSRLD